MPCETSLRLPKRSVLCCMLLYIVTIAIFCNFTNERQHYWKRGFHKWRFLSCQIMAQTKKWVWEKKQTITYPYKFSFKNHVILYSEINTRQIRIFFRFQSNTSVCLIISVFCKSCEPICELEITPVLYHLENLQKSKQKQFHVQCSVYKSYKTQKWTSSCIGNFEENMDLSRIYLAVQLKNKT